MEESDDQNGESMQLLDMPVSDLYHRVPNLIQLAYELLNLRVTFWACQRVEVNSTSVQAEMIGIIISKIQQSMDGASQQQLISNLEVVCKGMRAIGQFP